jgi:flagellar hook-associated protein 1
MAGLNTALLIGLDALNATETALNTTSNNIANANTPGYTEEVPQLSENALNSNDGSNVTGGGVTIDSIQSIRDELLNLQIGQQTSAQSSAGTLSDSLQEVQSYFSTTGGDIGSAFTAFASSLTALSANPASAAAQQGVIDAGQNLATAFNTTAAGLTSAQSTSNQQVTADVSQINTLSAQIAQLNGQLAQSGEATNGSNGGTIEDQRDELVQQLSTLTGINVAQTGNGTETITTGNGTPLVLGSQSFDLSSTAGVNGEEVLDSNGNDITASISGGDLGGSIAAYNQIGSVLSSLNGLATQVSTAFNAAQTAGFDSNGNPGVAFFSISNPNAAAASLSVTNGFTPSQVAINSNPADNDSDNIANLSAALTTAPAGGTSPEGAYASIIDQVGSAAQNASSQYSAIGSNLLQLSNQQSSESGVSIDDETTNLIRYQTSYEAAARIISTIAQLNTDTLDTGSSQSF